MTRDGRSTYTVATQTQSDHVRPPWPDGVVYHGSRLLLVVALAGAVTALFPPMGGSTLGRFEEGMVLTDAVIAQVPFTIPKSTAELQRGEGGRSSRRASHFQLQARGRRHDGGPAR